MLMLPFSAICAIDGSEEKADMLACRKTSMKAEMKPLIGRAGLYVVGTNTQLLYAGFRSFLLFGADRDITDKYWCQLILSRFYLLACLEAAWRSFSDLLAQN